MTLASESRQREYDKFTTDGDGDTAVRVAVTEDVDYEFCGYVTSGGYTYVALKKKSDGDWKIARINDSDNSDVTYCYGTTGFTAAWADYSGQVYTTPPDS